MRKNHDREKMPLLRRLMPILALLGCAGCVKKEFDRRLAEQVMSVTEQTSEIARKSLHSDSRPLRWNEALKLLKERNPELTRARQRSEDILRERDNQWKDWIPRPRVYANLNSSLAELGDLSFSDLNAAVTAPLTIPNPFTETARAFENSLSCLESKDSYEVSYRRQVISLYQLYSRMERIEQAQAISSSEDARSVTDALARLDASGSSRVAMDELQSQLVQMLSLPGLKPLPVATSRPKIDYGGRLGKFVPGRNYGLLAVRLSAYRIEGALLREKGVKMRKWPSLSLATSTPSLYESSGAGGDFTETERIRLFGGLSQSYDLVGVDVDSVKSAKDNTAYVKRNLRLQLDRDTRQWNRLKDQYGKIHIKKKLAREHLEKIRRNESGVSPSAQLALVREALKAFLQLELSKEQLDLEIWMWDDAAWK